MEAAEARATQAAELLDQVASRDQEVSERAEHLRLIHRINHLGPRFWEAVSIQKGS